MRVSTFFLYTEKIAKDTGITCAFIISTKKNVQKKSFFALRDGDTKKIEWTSLKKLTD